MKVMSVIYNKIQIYTLIVFCISLYLLQSISKMFRVLVHHRQEGTCKEKSISTQLHSTVVHLYLPLYETKIVADISTCFS